MLADIITYFSTLEQRPLERMAFIIGSMLILWIVEGAIPLLTLKYKKTKLKHAAVNLTFTLIHLIIHTGFGFLIVKLSDWAAVNKFGLVYWINASTILTIIIAALALDLFGGWLSHMIEHKVPLFWRMHIIHHADNNIDVTSGLRHHPLESIWRGVFFLIAIIISGAPIYAVMIYQTILTIFVAFTHANISLPAWFDKGLSYVLVSPNMHKVHHHWKQPYTDSNYGAVFSIWDRLFNTYLELDKSKLRYGLDRYYSNDKDEDLASLMKKPFGKLEE
ncbi:sterol desaturase family protein [Ferruginibacter sp.]|nr:sterol desaturase family protein [Ferruginibacter sp.]